MSEKDLCERLKEYGPIVSRARSISMTDEGSDERKKEDKEKG